MYLGYPASEKILASVEASFSSLDEKLFGAFLENKVNSIIGALEPGIYAGRYDFANGTPEPVGVSAYVVEVSCDRQLPYCHFRCHCRKKLVVVLSTIAILIVLAFPLTLSSASSFML